MKKLFFLSALFLLLGTGVVSAQASGLGGAVLTVGSNNTVGYDNSGFTDGLVAMGYGNSAYGLVCIALGETCAAVGYENFAMGKYAWVDGEYDGSAGYDNIAFNSSGIYAGSTHGFTANYGQLTPPSVNSVALNYGITSGGDALSANFGTATNDFSAAFGYSTVTASPAQFVIGMCNRAVGDNGYGVNPVFIIGNGTAATNSNAMQVRSDGLVLINPKGDVGMGEFTSGPIP